MRDPYEVLGVTRSASADQIKAAYRALAKKYHPDRYINSPLADSANTKMQEINDAYDSIMSGNAHQTYANTGMPIDYSAIENYINSHRFDQAEIELDYIAENARNAHWYFMKGKVNYARGWSDQAFTYFKTAHSMDPQNPEYRNAFNSMNSQRTGGFRTSNHTNANNSGCSGCDMCSGLLCADCCCECMGGDLISCC